MLRVYVKEKGSRELYPKAHGQIGMGNWVQRESPSIRSLGTFEVAVEYWPKHMLCRKQQSDHITSPRRYHCKASAIWRRNLTPSPKSSLPSGHHPALPCRCPLFPTSSDVRKRARTFAGCHRTCTAPPPTTTTVPTRYAFQRTEGGCPGDKTAEGGDSHGYCSLGYYVLTPRWRRGKAVSRVANKHTTNGYRVSFSSAGLSLTSCVTTIACACILLLAFSGDQDEGRSSPSRLPGGLHRRLRYV